MREVWGDCVPKFTFGAGTTRAIGEEVRVLKKESFTGLGRLDPPSRVGRRRPVGS
jgi:hypothetical protein